MGIALLMGNTRLYAQYWMQDAGGATPDEAMSSTLDDSNNIYTTGYFTSSANFGINVLTASGVADVFVTKVNSSGIFQWAVHGGGGANADRGLSIKADSKGNTYVTGFYFGTATFGTSTITSAGLQDVFVAKYDRNGNLRWLVSGGGTGSDQGNSVTIDNKDNVYITGQFTGTATFGTHTVTGTGTNINVFTARLDSATGNFLWAKSGIGPHTDRGLGVACDQAGNIYVTGQYSDTITFGTAHYSNFSNAIFIVKYNNLGNEIWFTKADATYSISNGITTDSKSNVYITGNYTGLLTFYAKTITTLTNIYSNKIFIAKYDSSASLLWSVADGSSSPVSSNTIALDSVGNPYVIGNFDCMFNSYSDRYGQGTFNSVGYWDVFVSEYELSAGAWQWSRQLGGHGNNYGYGIAVSSKGDVYTSGSFDQDLIIPAGSTFLGYNLGFWPFGCNGSYCSDPLYGSFGYFNTSGNLDAFIAKPIDLTRQPYDFYMRSGSGCSRPQIGVCITDNAHTLDSCPDTLKYCQFGQLWANSNVCSPLLTEAGPHYTYLWSTGDVTTSTTATSTGWYWVTQTSVDGCFKTTDSVYVVIHPIPAKPWISDNVVINTKDTVPNPIKVCADSVRLTGGNYGSDKFYWVDPKTDTVRNAITEGTSSGDYCFIVVDPFGCENATCVHVRFDSMIPPIIPKLLCVSCVHDTISVCQNTEFGMFAYDSISNPLANTFLCIPPSSGTVVKWSVTPNTISYSPTTTCVDYDENYFLTSDSGWYNITATVVRINSCDTSILSVSDSVYVHFYPQPPPITLTITGKTILCPGDSTWLVAHGSSNYSWSNSATTDSIRVAAGSYNVFSEVINTYGCYSIGVATATVSYTPQPNITMNPSNGIVCPNDSVQLTCSGAGGTYAWQGPSGPIPGSSPVIYVKTPGYYYCIESDTNGCVLLSNTVLIGQYSTPYLSASPAQTICPGDSAKISVIAPNGSIINWFPPLGGNDTVQYVNLPGKYKCSVTSCGITTIDSVVIKLAHPFAKIIPIGSTTFCSTDSLQLNGNIGMASYDWSPGGQKTRIIKVDSSGTYVLTTMDTNGCVARDSITVTAVKATTPTISLSKDSICPTDSATLSATGGGTYLWSPGGATSASVKVSPGVTTTYSVFVTTPCGTDTLSTVLDVEKVPVITVSGDSAICLGNSIVLTASGGYKYQWNPGGNYDTLKVTPSGTTSYTLAVSKGACVKDTDITVIVKKPAGTVSAKQNICKGESVTLTASGGGTYKWSNGATTSSISVSPDSTSAYSVFVMSNGCPDSLKTSVVVAVPSLAACCNDTILKGDTITIRASGNGSNNYTWTPSGNLSCANCPDPLANPTVTTTYTVTSTDSNGCQDIGYVTIFVINDCNDFTVPNVFTPNNDGINDDFVINPHDVDTYSINIYDRWGKEVYTSTNPLVYWNGRILNTEYLVPDGVYFYIIKASCSGKNYLKKGYVQVLGEK